VLPLLAVFGGQNSGDGLLVVDIVVVVLLLVSPVVVAILLAFNARVERPS